MEIRIKKRVSAVLIIALLCAQLVPGIRISSSSKEIDDKYIEIRTLNDLLKIQSNPDGKYILMDDIDLSSYKKGGSADTGHGWTPIEFDGVFDGNGHRIKNMTIYGNLSVCQIGLFKTNYNGYVKNLSMTNVDIDINIALDKYFGYSVYVGAVADKIRDVSSTYVDGKIRVTVSDLGEKGIIPEIIRIGGVAGEANCSDCINKASVVYDGKEIIPGVLGGIVGGERDVSIYNCINLGKISKETGSSMGSIIGEGKADNCYYLNNNVDAKDVLSGQTCLTADLMSIEGSFKDFDFDFTWCIDLESSIKHPQLRCNRIDRVEKMAWNKLPSKRVYKQGEKLLLNDAIVDVTYEKAGGKSISAERIEVCGYHSFIIGSQKAKLYLDNKYIELDVNVEEDSSYSIRKDDYDIVMSKDGLQSIKTKSALDITWDCSDKQIVVIRTDNGEDDNHFCELSAIRSGAVVITATANNGVIKTYTVVVATTTDSIKVNKKQVDLTVGETIQILVTVDPPDSNMGLIWSSSDEKVANVVNGKITAVGSGTAKIKVQSGDKIAEVTVTVNGDGSSVSNPTASPGEASETSTPTPTAKPNSVKKPGKVIGLKVKRTKKKITGKTVKVWNKYTWDKVKGCDGYRIEVYYDYKRLNGDDPIWHLSKGWYYDEIKKNKRTDLVCEYCHGEYDAYVKVRVRAYVKNKNGKKVFGKWSVVKKTDWKP